MWHSYRCSYHKERSCSQNCDEFCQARLSPPIVGQLVAEASIEGTEQYSREVYEEYLEQRKILIDGVNRIPGCYTPIPMGAFYTVVQLPVDDAEDFCMWCLKEFYWKDDYTPKTTNVNGQKCVCEGETIMMAPAQGSYMTPNLGKNQVCLAYVLYKRDILHPLFLLEKALEQYNQVEKFPNTLI